MENRPDNFFEPELPDGLHKDGRMPDDEEYPETVLEMLALSPQLREADAVEGNSCDGDS